MVKEHPLAIYLCDTISKVSIYLLVFFTPLFFIPWTADILDSNKQLVLALFVFVALFAWMLKALVSGSVSIATHRILVMVGVAGFVYLLSTIFSVNRSGSFWGWPQVPSESLFSLICFVVLSFLVSSYFSEKEILTSFAVLAVSVLIVQLYGFLELVGIYPLFFIFANSQTLNTIGSVGSFALFAVALLPLWIIMIMKGQRWVRVVCGFNIALALAILLLINYQLVWWTMLVVAGVMVVCWAMKRDIFDGRWISLPVFFLVVALFFLVLKPQINWVPQKSVEISLSHLTNIKIDLNALKAFPIFGSGPGTFLYDFLKYKNRDFNNSVLWNVTFSVGASKILTSLATLGILGFLSLVALLGMVILYGAKSLVFDTSNQQVKNAPLLLGVLAVLTGVTFSYFFYNGNITLDFIYFFCVAVLVALITKNPKTYILKPSSLLTLLVTLVFTIIFIFGMGLLMLEGQRLVADVQYAKGVRAFSRGSKDEAIQYVKLAASNNVALDLYFNQLALYSLSKLQDKAASFDASKASQEDKTMIQTLVSDSIGAANIAIRLGPNNVENWSTKGYVCQNLIALLPDAKDCAIQSYDKAITLSPTNPYLFLQEGNVYLAQANAKKDQPQGQSQNRENLISEAEDKFSKAIDLKEDYSLVYFQKALLERLQSNNDGEAEALSNAEKYYHNDVGLLFQIGLVYYQDKNWDRAQTEFQRALSIVPNYANALYYSGLTYSQQGQKDNAISQFSKLLQLNPGNETVKKILDNLKNNKSALDGLVQQAPTVTNPSLTTESGANPPKVILPNKKK